MKTITIRTSKGLEYFDTGSIIRIQGMSNYSKIFFADKSYPLTVAKVLHWFEKQLPDDGFWRTHKTHLVNSRHIKDLYTTPKPYLVLNNGDEVVISRRRVSLLGKIA